jgi:cytochrome c5
MRLSTQITANISRALSSGIITILLSVAMINTAGAADIAAIYNDSCAACHNSGALNAIKKGDSAKWQQLKQQKGMPALIKSVKNGMIQMPAGGLCNSCSDEDYRQLIEYMSK